MGRKIIVAGIDTDAGKTVASAILCEALQADYWKPVQAGDLKNTDSHKVKQLISNEKTVIHPEAYRLSQPMSPHAAAAIDGIEIDEKSLTVPATENHLIIELAGGLMVPLRKDLLNIDWIKQINFPVVLVAHYYLGSINHTLLSWELLQSRGVNVLGVIFNGDKNPSTFDVINERTQSKCLLEIEREKELNAATIRTYANRVKL
ncbi:MAG: dethiobiotin synthase [Bacteroidota bacterium]